MNGVRVGDLVRAKGEMAFRYEERWLDLRGALPISLSIPISSEARRGDTVANFFDNLMPDSAAARQRLQRAVGAESSGTFDLLAELGSDCVGALQFHGEEAAPDVRTIAFEPWTESQVAQHLADIRRPQPLARGGTPFRISIAGAQDKTALLRHGGQWCKPLGPTPTTHIFKPAIGLTADGVDLSRSVENEWLCARILRAFGLSVAASEVLEFEGQRVLVVERFDRRLAPDGDWWMRLPQEDLCQATGTSAANKYEQDGGPGILRILELLGGATEPLQERLSFLKAQLVFWLLAAIDGHGKNFSLSLMAGSRYALTPLYDVLSAHPAVNTGDLHQKNLSMAMALQGKNRHYVWEKIQPRHWLETARLGGIGTKAMDAAIDAVLSSVHSVLGAVAQDASLISTSVSEPILEGVDQAAQRFQRLR